MTSFVSPLMFERIVRIHAALREAGIPHAFGGAIANAFHGEPRATTDIDINIFLPEEDHQGTLRALEHLGVTVDWSCDVALIRRDGQVRLRWDRILVDLFFATFDFLYSAHERVVTVPFVDGTIPILSAEDLIVCKVAFNREKDWFDLRNIVRIQATRLDGAYIDRWLATFGQDDPRITRFHALLAAEGC
jgi:hypothetical protein